MIYLLHIVLNKVMQGKWNIVLIGKVSFYGRNLLMMEIMQKY